MAQEMFVDLGFDASDNVAFATISSVFGQLSDGKWENSLRMTGYWLFADVVKNDGKICLKVSTKGFDNSFFKKGVDNPYVNMRTKQIMGKIANFIKAVAKDEYPSGWDRKNTAKCDFLSRDNITVRVCDAYRVYDALKQRKPKVYASVAKNLIKIARALVADENDVKIINWCRNVNKEGEKLKSFVFCPHIYFSTLGGKKVCFGVHIGYTKSVWGKEIANQDVGLKKIVDFLNKKSEECKKLFPNIEIEW